MIIGTHPHVVQPLEVCFVNGYESRLKEQADLPALDHPSGCIVQDETGIPRKALIMYSLGNFVTAMYTMHCRTGLILGVQLERDVSGRVDWHRPEIKLVYNARMKMLRAGRRLMLLEHFLQHRERLGRRGEKVDALGVWLRRHL